MENQSRTPEPSKKKAVRVAMTKKQASNGIGLELIEISQPWIEDGRLDLEELDLLKSWLSKASNSELPAVKFLQDTIIKNGLHRSIDLEEEQASLDQADSHEYKESVEIERLDEITTVETRSINRPSYWKGHERELDMIL